MKSCLTCRQNATVPHIHGFRHVFETCSIFIQDVNKDWKVNSRKTKAGDPTDADSVIAESLVGKKSD